MNRFFGLNRIYYRSTGSPAALISLWSVAGLAIFGLTSVLVYSFLGNPTASLIAVSAITIAGLGGLLAVIRGLGRQLFINRLIRRRRYAGRLEIDAPGRQTSCLGLSVLRQEARGGHRARRSTASFQAEIVDQGEGWWLTDVSWLVYNKHGQPVGQRCYTVFETKLRQIVPHLLFDSRRAKGRQFRSIYLKSASLQSVFGAEFERIFVSHSPGHHDLETLSFITPEVVEAMLGLSDSDLELIDNSLFCYGPLRAESELVDFRRRAANLHAKLNDNLRRYQPPEREVKPFGRRLLKNPLPGLITGLILLTIGLLYLGLGLTGGPDGAVWPDRILWGATFGLVGLAALVAASRQRRRNRELERQFLAGDHRGHKP